ncbi:hypothetical protein D3C87_1824600 [compost metagenome]
MYFYHIRSVGHKLIGHLTGMYQAVLVNTYIYKGTEIGNIGYNTWQFHSYF